MSVQFWTEFIQLFQENICLWDTRSPEYKDELKKKLAYGFLVEKMWEIDQNAELEDVINKIKNMVAEYKEQKEIMSGNRSKTAESKWRYYEHFRFLDVLDVDDVTDAESVKEEAQSASAARDSAPGSSRPTSVQVKQEYILVAPPRTTTPVVNAPADEGQLACSPSAKRRRSNPDDECTFLCAFVENKLREVDPRQKCIAQKLISDVIFYAATGQLQMSTCITKLAHTDE